MKKIPILLCCAIIAITAFIILYEESLLHPEQIFTSLLQKRQRADVEYMEREESKERSALDVAPDEYKEKHEEYIVKLTDEQVSHMGLETQLANPGKMTLAISTRGKLTIDPDRLAHVIPKISGVAKEAKKNIGNDIKEGEVIAILESQEAADLKAAYLSTLNKEKIASEKLERENKLFQKRISARQDLLDAQNDHQEAYIQLLLHTQKLQTLGLSHKEIDQLAYDQGPNLRSYPIYSPMSGTLMKRHITQGEYIDHQSVIYEIADLSHLWVEVGIYPKDLKQVRDHQLVEVMDPETQQTTQARVIYISPTLTDDTLTAKMIALLDNRDRSWRPGTFVKVNILTDSISCPLIISKEAIQKIDGKECTFVKTEKGFEKRELQLGQSDQKNVEVLAGLLPGEQYVANRSFLLKAEMNKELIKDDD